MSFDKSLTSFKSKPLANVLPITNSEIISGEGKKPASLILFKILSLVKDIGESVIIN